ncbi:DUF5011 domain-containing protein [Clostridium sp. ZS2-4]|nr:DUF5011 domain-containing protein [Clostridium sp. ZS2-4]
MARQSIYGDEISNPEENTKPTILGVSNKTINVGDEFDPKAGITAADKEDGDLTSKIQIEGSVDTSKAGIYTLTYSVLDSKGLTAAETCIVTVKEQVQSDSNFGVGQGIEWPAQVNTPFTDMLRWINNPEYSNNGTVNLVKISEDTGIKFFNLGFIQAISSTIVDGKLQWGWGGYSVLNEQNNDNTQYQGIKKSIKELREIGGDVAISFGGANGTAPWQATQDVNVLTNTYRELVKGYGLTNINLDIEGASQGKTINIANAKAIKAVQDETGVDVVLTIPVMPTGLTQDQINVLEAYLSQGVDLQVVNLMTMCYGTGSLLPGEDYGTASVRAVDNAKNQLKDVYKNFANMDLTDEEAYAKLGTTPSIGFESSAHPIFTTDMAQVVVNHAIEKKLGMTSYWSMNRDAKLESNTGIPSQYAFTNIFKNFENGEVKPPQNTKPVLSGIENKTIKVGDTFDPMQGITATDKEDGNITDKIQIQGTVDTNTAGNYTLTYTVSDSEGLSATRQCTITVVEESGEDIQAWSREYAQSHGYLPGVKVTHKGKIWLQVGSAASWWAEPGTAWVTEWQAIGDDPNYVEPPIEEWSESYQSSHGYAAGTKVMYKGHKYLQTGGTSGMATVWWGEPGTPSGDAFWKLID